MLVDSPLESPDHRGLQLQLFTENVKYDFLHFLFVCIDSIFIVAIKIVKNEL